MTQPTSTHWWTFEVEVVNEFRGRTARVGFRWWSSTATLFEAAEVRGSRHTQLRDAGIVVYFNERRHGRYASKDEATAAVSELLAKTPSACAADFAIHKHILIDAIKG